MLYPQRSCAPFSAYQATAAVPSKAEPLQHYSGAGIDLRWHSLFRSNGATRRRAVIPMTSRRVVVPSMPRVFAQSLGGVPVGQSPHKPLPCRWRWDTRLATRYCSNTRSDTANGGRASDLCGAFILSVSISLVVRLVSVAKGKIVRQNRHFQRFSAASFACQSEAQCLSLGDDSPPTYAQYIEQRIAAYGADSDRRTARRALINVADTERMIAEYDRKATELEKAIRAEEDRAGIRDPAHVAYPAAAKERSRDVTAC
jgi:hypothetical protein